MRLSLTEALDLVNHACTRFADQPAIMARLAEVKLSLGWCTTADSFAPASVLHMIDLATTPA